MFDSERSITREVFNPLQHSFLVHPARGWNPSFWRCDSCGRESWEFPEMLRYSEGHDFNLCSVCHSVPQNIGGWIWKVTRILTWRRCWMVPVLPTMAYRLWQQGRLWSGLSALLVLGSNLVATLIIQVVLLLIWFTLRKTLHWLFLRWLGCRPRQWALRRSSVRDLSDELMFRDDDSHFESDSIHRGVHLSQLEAVRRRSLRRGLVEARPFNLHALVRGDLKYFWDDFAHACIPQQQLVRFPPQVGETHCQRQCIRVANTVLLIVYAMWIAFWLRYPAKLQLRYMIDALRIDGICIASTEPPWWFWKVEYPLCTDTFVIFLWLCIALMVLLFVTLVLANACRFPSRWPLKCCTGWAWLCCVFLCMGSDPVKRTMDLLFAPLAVPWMFVDHVCGRGDLPPEDTLWVALLVCFLALTKLVLIFIACLIRRRVRHQAEVRMRAARAEAERSLEERICNASKWPENAAIIRSMSNFISEVTQDFLPAMNQDERDQVEPKRLRLVNAIKREFPREMRDRELSITVNRATALEDTLSCLINLPWSMVMADRLTVKFAGEMGVDAGGLRRDWFNTLAQCLWSGAQDGSGHLCCLADGTLTPRFGDDRWNELFAIGRLAGLAVWHGIPFPLPLGSVWCRFVLAQPIGKAELIQLDKVYFKNHIKLVLENTIEKAEQTLRYELYFVSPSDDIELCIGGRQRRVTEENKKEYIQLVCQHRLCNGIREQIGVLLGGFWSVIPLRHLHDVGITHREIALLIAGFDDIDPDAWEQNADCSGAEAHICQWFWQVVHELSAEQRGSLLHFTTSSSRLPPGGFRQMQPRFKLNTTATDTTHLPVASTCFNTLNLPVYGSKDVLRERVLSALGHGVGFGNV